MSSRKWNVEVTFTEAPDGWLLTDLAIEPAAVPGIWEALAQVAHIIAEESQPGRPVGGGRYEP